MKCPYCARQIQPGTKRCPHCRELLDNDVIPRQKGFKQDVDHRFLFVVLMIVLGAVCYLVVAMNEEAQNQPRWKLMVPASAPT